MSRLSEGLKAEIVLRLARYEGYSAIARSISTELGVSVSRFQVRSYDPTKPTFAGGDKWRTIFDKERKRYCEEVRDVPISHQAFRLNQLQWILDRAKQTGNLVLAMKALEQAAKEVGGMHTNQRSIDLYQPPQSPCADLTLEERRERVSDILKEAIEKAQSDREAGSLN